LAESGKWADSIKKTLDPVKTLADSLIEQVKSKLASLAKHDEAKKVAEQAEMLQKAIDAAVDAVKDLAEGGPEAAAASLWASAAKAVIPNPLKEQAAKLEEEAQKIEVDGLQKLVVDLNTACGQVDDALADIEKKRQEIAADAGKQMKVAFTRYHDDAPKNGFDFQLFEAALEATQGAVQGANSARGLWAYLKAPLQELDEAFAKYTHVVRGREVSIDGEQVLGHTIDNVAGSRSDMVRNAKIKERNAKTVAAIGAKLGSEQKVAEAAFAEATSMVSKLMALSSVAVAALDKAPGKHAKAS